jgi:hypothetical protein
VLIVANDGIVNHIIVNENAGDELLNSNRDRLAGFVSNDLHIRCVR